MFRPLDSSAVQRNLNVNNILTVLYSAAEQPLSF
jgi:hypothetical protein